MSYPATLPISYQVERIVIASNPKITAFFRIKLLVFDFFFCELLRLGSRGYSDNHIANIFIFQVLVFEEKKTASLRSWG